MTPRIQLTTLSLCLPLSLFNLMNQLDLLYILLSQVLPHGLTHEHSKICFPMLKYMTIGSYNFPKYHLQLFAKIPKVAKQLFEQLCNF